MFRLYLVVLQSKYALKQNISDFLNTCHGGCTHECLQIRCSNFLSLLTLFSEFYLLSLVDIAQFKIKIIVRARNQRKNRAEIRSWLLQNLCSLNTRRGSLAELAAPVSNKSSPSGVLLSPSMDPKKLVKTTHFSLVFGSLFQFKKCYKLSYSVLTIQ